MEDGQRSDTIETILGTFNVRGFTSSSVCEIAGGAQRADSGQSL